MTLTGKEFQKDGVPLTEKVPAWYDEMFRGVVRSPELGDVRLDLEGVKDSMGHGIGREKSAAFAAVPDIIRKGTVFDRQSNWKGRGYDTSVISAPVRIGDTDYAGEVVVKHLPNRQGLYLHEVENKKRLEDAFKTPTEGSAPQASRLILGQQLDDVKRSSKVVDGEGRPLVVHHNTDAVFDVFSKDKINSRGAYGEGFYFSEKPAPYGQHQMDVYLKGTYGLPEKRAARRAGQPAQELDYAHVPDEGYWMVKDPNQIKSVQNRGTFNPDDPNIYKALPWAMGGAGTAAAFAPGEAQAAQKGEFGDGAPWRNVMDEMTRGLGTRNMLEGLGRGATPGISDPGKTISDFFGLPYRKGFKSITLYNPEASEVERLLKDKGYWEGGSTSSIFTPSLGERSKSIGSGTLSAVNNPSFANTIRGLDAWRKNKMLVTGGGGMLPLFDSGRAEGMDSAPEEPSSWDEFKRGLGLGTRNVLEGLGRGATLGLSDPGKTISDFFGLPVPETALEKRMALFEGGAAEAVPMIMGGGAMAKMAASPVTRGVGRELFATPGRDIALGGLLGSFLGGE